MNPARAANVRRRGALLLPLILALPSIAGGADGALRCVSPALPASAEAAARDYLIQKVCVDPAGKVLRVDPCRCAAPGRLRDLMEGEALPYHKVDQAGVQRKDAYPATTPDGREIIVSPFDFTPFGVFNLWGDGYDVYLIRDGWASASETRDGGGFSTTFFSPGCRPYNGWAFFPLSALGADGVASGKKAVAISGRYWEQNGESWPGRCPSAYSENTLTSWEPVDGFPFGGKDGSPVKSIDAIRVVHGLSPDPRFSKQGHLEVFYFTRLYGITRWEVWAPESQGGTPADAKTCGGDVHVVYEGLRYLRTACRDWSSIQIPAAPEPPLAWPLPPLNLLKNFHFADGAAHWSRRGKSAEGRLTNWRLMNSALSTDTRFRQPGGKGVRYLAINCGGRCSPDQEIFQEAPAAAESRSYDFAATLRSENGSGSIRLKLVQLDANGAELSSDEATAAVGARNERFTGADSVLLSATFVTGTAAVRPEARTVRLAISPESSGTFDVIDAWLIRR